MTASVSLASRRNVDQSARLENPTVVANIHCVNNRASSGLGWVSQAGLFPECYPLAVSMTVHNSAADQSRHKDALVYEYAAEQVEQVVAESSVQIARIYGECVGGCVDNHAVDHDDCANPEQNPERCGHLPSAFEALELLHSGLLTHVHQLRLQG